MIDGPPTPDDDPGDVTTWLRRLREQPKTGLQADGSGSGADAHDALAPLVYDELHRLAVHLMRGEQSPITLQPTALVHEAWMRLVQQHSTQFNDRAHFFAIAVRLMRRVLVDQARRRSAVKRDGGVQESIDNIDIEAPVTDNADEVLRVHTALEKFAELHERQAQVVELRFFAGLTTAEIAALIGVSEPTVKRDWVVARAWLQRELSASA
ncbi:MAG: ECF-type sigma factor [Gemmatimonadaceae bacterium]